MTLLEIYEKVNLTAPIEQRRFFNYFEDTVNELLSLYGEFALNDGKTEFLPPKSLSSQNPVPVLYHSAIVDNILFLSGRGEVYKSEFIRKSQAAYLKYWNDNAKGRRIRKGEW